jgi:hypothetical protein
VDSASKREKLKATNMLKNAVRTHRQVHAVLGGSSLPCSITEENHATAKAAFLQKLKLQSNVVWEGWFAPSYDDRDEKQLALVDQPCSKGVGSQLRTTDEDILFNSLF